mmetsp:Transcript_21244/g.36224  ORF Transcript_21244/g.36224 Transcript_21244/m.36224 type:complete len:125 (+) Transcript_21244:70-444(+)
MIFLFFIFLIFLNIIEINCKMDKDKERIAVHLQPHANPDEVAALHGFENLGPVGDLENHYVFQKLHPHEMSEDVLPTHIGVHRHVKWWENQVSRNRRRPHIGLEEPPQKNNVDDEEEALKRDSL